MAELGHSRFPLLLAEWNSLPSGSSRTVVSFEIFITASGSEISILVELPLWMICTGLRCATGVCCAVSQVEMADEAKPWGHIEAYFLVLIYKYPPGDYFFFNSFPVKTIPFVTGRPSYTTTEKVKRSFGSSGIVNNETLSCQSLCW